MELFAFIQSKKKNYNYNNGHQHGYDVNVFYILFSYFFFFFNSLFFPCSFFSCIISKYFFLIFMECHMAGYSCVTVCIFYFIHIFIQTGCSFVQENVLFVLSTYTNTNNSFSCMIYKNSFYLISAYIQLTAQIHTYTNIYTYIYIVIYSCTVIQIRIV